MLQKSWQGARIAASLEGVNQRLRTTILELARDYEVPRAAAAWQLHLLVRRRFFEACVTGASDRVEERAQAERDVGIVVREVVSATERSGSSVSRS